MPAPPLVANLAEAAWREAAPALARKPLPPRPVVVVMAGVPLSGKSTLARALVAAAPSQALHVENDAVRARLAAWQRKDVPAHDGRENFLTHLAAWELARRGLAAGAHVLLDGTYLTERGRRGAYGVAEQARAPALLVVVRTAPEVMAARVAANPEERQAAHRKLGGTEPQPSGAVPTVVLDGAAPPAASLALLRTQPAAAPLFA